MHVALYSSISGEPLGYGGRPDTRLTVGETINIQVDTDSLPPMLVHVDDIHLRDSNHADVYVSPVTTNSPVEV